MLSTVRIGMVGAGAVAARHVRTLLAMEGVEVAAVAVDGDHGGPRPVHPEGGRRPAHSSGARPVRSSVRWSIPSASAAGL